MRPEDITGVDQDIHALIGQVHCMMEQCSGRDVPESHAEAVVEVVLLDGWVKRQEAPSAAEVALEVFLCGTDDGHDAYKIAYAGLFDAEPHVCRHCPPVPDCPCCDNEDAK